jgi:hypothetical protein
MLRDRRDVDLEGGGEAGPGGDTFEVPVTLTVFGASPSAGIAVVRRRSLASRARRAAVALGAAWLLAFPAIFLPVAHFVLVPGLVIGGVVLAAIRLRESRTLDRLRATCPRCGAALDVRPGGRFSLPRPVQCVHCRNQLTLGPVDTPGDRTSGG